MRRGQRGQAIVLITMMFGVLCGMVGLAIDGGRAYVDHSMIQNSADAAAAAGATTYIRDQSMAAPFTLAEQAVRDTYMLNRGLSSPSCSPDWAAPSSGGSVSFSCTFGSDSSQALTITVQDYAPPSSFDDFTATGSQSLLTALIQVAGAANTVPISATGCAATWDSSTCAAVPPVVLGTSTLCGTGGDSVKLVGSDTSVVGNVGTYGDVEVPSGSHPQIAGDTTYSCGSGPNVTSMCYPSGAVLPCATYPTSSFHTGKPPQYNIPTGSGNGTVETFTGTAVNLDGGVIDSTTVSRQGFGTSGTEYFGFQTGPYKSPCIFLGGGVYDLKGVSGYFDGGVISNEIRPPDEPDINGDPTTHKLVAAKQLWNMNSATCAGSFTAAEVPDATGFAMTVGDYAIRLTSVRYDTVNGHSYERESAPSACKTTTVSLPTQGISINVSNVPGAQDYNVYMSSPVLSAAASDGDPNAGKCNGYFYQLATIPVQNYVNETNVDTSACPSSVTSVHCTLGVSSVADLNLCTIDRFKNLKGLLAGGIPVNCTALLNSIPDIQPQPAFSCTASAYVQVPPPKGTLKNPPISHSCGWPGPFVSCTGGSSATPPPYCLEEFLAPADANLPDQDEAVNYEIGNWGLCYDPSTFNSMLCPNQYGGYTPGGLQAGAPVTPGAVQFQADSGGCYTFTSNDYPFLFSGYQYSWGLLIHAGPTTSGCADSITPAYGGELVGHYYGPSVNATVAGTTSDIPVYGPQAPTLYGCFIASRPTVDGTNGLAVYFVTPSSNPAIAITGYGIPTGSGC
ncbi:MAG TPA: pilus assembly protein TadG-related protein [Candidatus Dormibacteraeota bacterium]